MKLELVRRTLGEKATTGDLYVDGAWEAFSLEDHVRTGPKVPGETAIPEGVYRVIVTPSPRFKRPLPLLVNVPGFDGIRIHPGNSHEDTHGCLLVGEGVHEFSGEPRLTKSASAFTRLFEQIEEALDAGEVVSIHVRNEESV